MAPRILVIDDSENIRTTLRLTLEFKGYEVVEAEDGAAGVEAIEAADFDLVFCDLAMPRLGGIDVIRRARGDLGKPDLPIIILSAEEKAAKRAALDAGANGSVDKPFSPQDILQCVADRLGADA